MEEPDTQPIEYSVTRRWGRWGDNDQKGAINLINPEKVAASARLVRSGLTVSLSRQISATASAGNPVPAERHFRTILGGEKGGAVVDYLGLDYHGFAMTHLDALAHIWMDGKIWGGGAAEENLGTAGLKFADVDNWATGIVTRGVLFDVPRFRKMPFVDIDRPVLGSDLVALEEAQGVRVEPGDALFVYCGRESWEATYGPITVELSERPGLHASCRRFIAERDVALLGWDMGDAYPNEHDGHWSVHGVLQAYGVALLDNAALAVLSQACEEQGTYEFLVVVAPLRVPGGTGSPVNPIAVF